MNNYSDNICDYIRLHKRGDESVLNVTGLLFYLGENAPTRTCGEVLKAIQKVTSCEYISEIKALMR